MADPKSASLGEGFIVWESNRTADWRIWFRRLDGSGLRQLSPDEDGQQHCCPHVSPGGRSVVYLSRAVPRNRYPKREVAGALRLIAVDGSEERALVEGARTCGRGNRAAVWRGENELIYIAEDGRTMLLEMDRGRSRLIASVPMEKLGWLVDSTLSYATTGLPSFSLYDAERRQVEERRAFGGCEPYFSHDGRWGFWVASPGGPIHRIDLATREVSAIMRKSDPRMPGQQGYLYFPMLSADGQLFAFGASADEHDHFRSDYDIYVAPMDPRTLELLRNPVRLTGHPATDRYPDVFLEPLELGRHFGEAPLTLRFAPPGNLGELEWDYGDGRREPAGEGRHTFHDPGIWEVRARHGEHTLRAQVVVEAPRAPQVSRADLRTGGRQIVVRFDEDVRFEDPVISLESGLEVADWHAGDDGRSLVIGLERRLVDADRLHLQGVFDQAQVPNRMPPAEIEVAAPSWPSDRRGLVFLWQTADAANLVYDPEVGVEQTYTLEPRGLARLDHDYAMVLGGGAFAASPKAAGNVLAAAQASNELTLEATLTSSDLAQIGPARIMTFSTGLRQRNFTLGQEGRFLNLRLRTGSKDPNAEQSEIRLFELEAGRPDHVVVSYRPGRLAIYRNGEQLRVSEDIQNGFNRWKPSELLFGDEAGGGRDWSGTLEGIAIYNRILKAGEVRENFLRSLQIRRERPPVPRLVVRGRLRAKSTIPTLDKIAPYRQALAVFDYEVAAVLKGEYDQQGLRVAHWTILNGEKLPVAAAAVGATVRLVLEPFGDNPQLEGHYLSNTLEPRNGLSLFYDVGS